LKLGVVEQVVQGIEIHTGLLHSRKSFLACQGMQSFVELIAKFPSGVGEIAGSTASEQSPGCVVEHRQQGGSLSHAQLRMILAHRGIPSIMQAVFNAPVSSNQLQEALGISQSGWQLFQVQALLITLYLLLPRSVAHLNWSATVGRSK